VALYQKKLHDFVLMYDDGAAQLARAEILGVRTEHL